MYSYVGINVLAWVVWYWTAQKNGFDTGGTLPWPAWVTLGWGLGLYFNYSDAYAVADNAADKEYKKLKDREEQGNL